MLIPFLKIPAHYSASDRAGLKRLEKNLKIKKQVEKSVKNQQKKRSIPPKKALSKRLSLNLASSFSLINHQKR
ncbi:hypothetical protein ACM37_05355 [Helicobacter pylori]|uniref:hypothetical protein n=1 Tax=Helicobacter pylori TaxID=210 RepID=UPI000680BD94|nr:hypothetical protein [Helicobacter pylori]KNE23383.1 hypothetical protein ACM37_05355 [Helicobacter pylori]